MFLLFLPIGIALPTLTGVLLLRAIEGKAPVLSSIERWAAGFIVGLTGTMYATFLAHIVGLIRLDRTGFLVVQLLLASLLVIARWCSRRPEPSFSSADRCGSDSSGQREQGGEERRNVSWPRWARVLLCILLVWTGIKIAAVSVTFLFTPLYVDDAIDNWNMRGKLLFHHQELVLGFPGEPPPPDGGVFAYPPTVPMAKAWLALLAGSWHEPLVNGIHVLWFLALLGLLFGTLRAAVGSWWALLGLYIFGSLPLPLLHATNPYADMFLAAHVGAAACFLLRAMTTDGGKRTAGSFLRLAALPLALLPFTKNEGLVLYLPILALTLALALFHLRHRGTLPWKSLLPIMLWATAIISAVLLPWLSFKWAHGFSFGNAKGLPNILEFAWYPLSLRAIVVNTIFEGNWLLLFPLFFAILAWQWRRAFAFPLLVLSVPFLLAYTAQIALFTFTPLATEAVRQTGYARGIIHLLPIVVLLTTLLLYSSPCPPTPRSSDTSRT